MGCKQSSITARTSDEERQLKGKLVKLDGAMYMKIPRSQDKLPKGVEEKFFNIVQSGAGPMEEGLVNKGEPQ